MKSILSYKSLVGLALCLLPGTARTQDIEQIAKSDPLIISGSVGTRNTYYHSSIGSGYASPLSNTIYANLNISIYGYSMPFSLYYSNDNLDFNYPHLSFNISPTYKNWTAHIGRSSMPYSNYVMNMSFNGVGLEYNSQRLRAGAFYGTLRSAVNDDPLSPTARRPQYKRVGWGVKVGYGSQQNYLDLYLLRVYDRPRSLDNHWRQAVSPQENLVLGLKGRVSIKNWLSLTANMATSVFSTDIDAKKIENSEATRFDKIFDVRYSSLMRFAGDVNMNLSLKNFNTSVFYRMVQPDYMSLGSYYMPNNYHSLGLNMSTSLFKKVVLSATFSGQEDNLTNKQMFTTRGFVYSANASTSIGTHANISAGYNGYLQTQGDGTAKVVDSTMVHRIMHSFNVMPSFFFNTSNLGHNLSLTASFVKNEDLNKFSKGDTDIKTLAVGLSYGVDIESWGTSVSATVSHQQSKSNTSTYTSDIGSMSISRSFLQEKNLNISVTGSLCYNEIKQASKSLSLGVDAALSYTLNKVHVFSLSGGLNKYGDVNISHTRSNLDDTDVSATFTYAYTFSIFEIKRKKTM
ncbi:hypothetical protein [Hallella bergensis]|uniref:hypothetical protein n=1 Tax=Hallella bergensis TaxID=242750 RepID=UPI0023F2F3B0|nr:hypothetical protein [Hallella bergensis]